MVKKKNSRQKKMVPKDGASDTQNGGTLFSVYFSVKRDGKLPEGIPKRTLRRYTKILKSSSIIKYKSYGVWALDNIEKAKEYEQKYYQKDGAISGSISGGVTPSHFPFTDKRGHRLLLTITTPALPLKKLKTHFGWKDRGRAVWKDGGDAGKYLQVWFGGVKFNLYENKIQVEFNKSFYSDHHITTQDMAMTHYKAVLTTFENNMPMSIRIGKELLVRASMEFEKMNSDFAKYCYEKGLNIRFTAGEFRYWQDGSGGTRNEEGNKATTMDALEGVAQVNVMKTAAEYAEITGGRNILLDLSKQVTELRQSLNIETPIEEKKKFHKDLPSYFG